jgi:hypothetical protein
MGAGTTKAFRIVTAAIALLALPACDLLAGFSKLGNAVAPTTLTTEKFAASAAMVDATNLSRASGWATYARLQALFPNIRNVVSSVEFTPQPNNPNDAALGSKTRPSSAQAQYVLRSYTTTLCTTQLSTSTLFQTSSILMAGETLPTDPALALAFAAARNAWLFPYAATSGEVQQLEALYNALVTKSATGKITSDTAAREAVCLAALSTSNFWIGNQDPNDVVRKLALELAWRPPTFQEYDDYINKRVTLAQYVTALQKEPSYLQAVNSWHKDWLLLYWDDFDAWNDNRPPMNWQGNYLGHTTPVIVRYNYNEPTLGSPNETGANGLITRAGGFATAGFFNVAPGLHTGPKLGNALVRWEGETGTVTGLFSGSSPTPDATHLPVAEFPPPAQLGGPVIAAQANGDYLDYWNTEARYGTETYLPVACDITNIQPFDPRSVEFLYEQYNPLSARWETIGSWQLLDSGGHIAAPGTAGTWTMVPGSITTASGQVQTTLADISYASSTNYYVSADPYSYQPNYPTHGVTSKLIGTPLESFYTRDRRIRRFAPGPSGPIEQNGVSQVTIPRTGTKAYVCNGVDHFMATCAFRPNSRKQSDFDQSVTIGYGTWTPAVDKMTNLYSQWEPVFRYSLMTPSVLDSMKCGIPNPAAMARIAFSSYATPEADPNEDLAWPWGYPNADPTAPFGQKSVTWGVQTAAEIQGSLNSVAYYPPTNTFWEGPYDGWSEADSLSLETQAQATVDNDLAQEPYRLIDDIVSNDKDYRLLVTANYTWGTDYYEKLLREQGYFLPGGPQLASGGAFTPAPNPSPSTAPVHMINFPEFAPIPIQALQSVAGTYSTASIYNDPTVYMADLAKIGQINPKRHAGLLNMPAFLSEYTPGGTATALDSRTMADRYFERLMCSSPASFVPTDSQGAMQAQFVPNVTGAAGGPNPHLSKTMGCYQCHINLDPLAVALNANFFNIGITTYASGELRVIGGGGFYQGEVYGIRGGGPPSKGGFLGQEVNGLADVSETLANSTQFNSCVVQKAMEEVYGRDPVIADATAFTEVVNRFMSHHSYNQMIIDLVSMPSFTKPE